MRLKRALDEYVIEGIDTNISSLKKIISHDDFINCNFDISWFDKILENN
jgi:acetyl-CoA carboxylase biotin carboxylase subunit